MIDSYFSCTLFNAFLGMLLFSPFAVLAADAGPVVYSQHVYRDAPATNYQYRNSNTNNENYTVAKDYYRVQPGDTIGAIAQRLKIKIKLLIKRNGLRAPYLLKPGQRLCIDQTCAKKLAAKVGQYYYVQKGDTVDGIALRLAMKPASLIQINHLRYPYRLKLKQRLCVNAVNSCKKIKRKAYKKTYNKHYYYVRSGDSVERIARKLHLKQALIIRRNQLKPPYLLQQGQRLCINKKSDCKHHKKPKKSIYHYH
ncbi:MAG: LysM peptidoglycan-binding domain-containing protein, partial [Mariprofundaceae bacterium]|nr:LysM peptidoglycan-binding domain-containing protein [Mariprofundaceae bacterium]